MHVSVSWHVVALAVSLSDAELSKQGLMVLGLDGSYHGDTLGAMNMQSPSIFTGPRQFAW
jgi:hypothetical protein